MPVACRYLWRALAIAKHDAGGWLWLVRACHDAARFSDSFYLKNASARSASVCVHGGCLSATLSLLQRWGIGIEAAR